jgi:tryptophan synthase alpha chain
MSKHKNKIDALFERKRPFIGYLTGGDGGIDYTVECALALAEGGVDLLEIGLPFSDPVADGPVIQKAHQRGLAAGTIPENLLEMGKRIRRHTEVPLVLFSYFNPLLKKGKPFLHSLKDSGFDALLVVDQTFEGNGKAPDPYLKDVIDSGLLPILLATPSTDDERLAAINKFAAGFVYYVSQKGTTGVRGNMASDFAQQMLRLRKHIKIPIAAGFGIGDRATAQEALAHADGFIVGSAFVKLMENEAAPHQLSDLARTIDPRIKG